ncbi:MAG: protein kinase [Planctomycetota bacterium]
MTDLAALVGGELSGWRLERLLGKGAMGAVFEAREVAPPGRHAALKVILAGREASEALRLRFVREARAISRIQDEHVCGCLGHGEDEVSGLAWLALEFIEGRDLAEVLKLRGALSVEETLDYMQQLLRGLAAAHAAGVIHRDLKPANAILTAAGVVKLVDFGLARRDDESLLLTAEGSVLGTPHYMSPEQVEGKPADHRADLYSLGAMVFHLLAGRPPFQGRTTMQILAQHATAQLPPIRDYCPEAPAALDRMLARMCAKDPEVRYPDAQAALTELERVLRRREKAREPAAARGPASGRASTVAPPATPARPEPPRGEATRLEPPPAGARPAQPGPAPSSQAQPAPLRPVLRASPLPPLLGALAGLALGFAGATLAHPLLAVRLGAGLVLAGIGLFVGLRLARLGLLATPEPSPAARLIPAEELGDRAAGLEHVGRFEEAAELYAARGDHARAAGLFERAGRPLDAAASHRAAGSLEPAARLLEQAGQPAEAAQLLADRAAELEARRGSERNARRQAAIDADLARVVERASALFQEVGRPRDAARLLARAGQHRAAAELYLTAGDRDLAAEQYVKAGDRARAAELHERAGDVVAAARLEVDTLLRAGDKLGAARALEQAGDLARAARYYEEGGDVLRAAELLDREGAHQRAAELFAAGGKHLRAAQLFAREGDVFEAARAYQAAGRLEEALEAFRRVEPGGREHAQALRQIARLEEDLAERAAQAPAAEIARSQPVAPQPAAAQPAAPQPAAPQPATPQPAAPQPATLQPAGAGAAPSRRAGPPTGRPAGPPPGGPPTGARPGRPGPGQPGAGSRGAGPPGAVRRPGGPPSGRPAPSGRAPAGGGAGRPAGAARPAPTARPADPARWVGQEIDRYRVVDVLGSGAFADVLRVEHVHLERPAALKLLRPDVASRPEVRERFLAEAKLVSRIRHPGVVQVYDFGEVEALPWMALELIDGSSLRETIARGPVGVDEARRIARELIAAVAAAHAAGVVHRDLKPENVLLDRAGAVHVLDFGLARVFWGTRRDDGAAFLGTPRYASPEAAAGEDVSAPADQYAIGLILYELLCGRGPFQSESAVGYLHHHRSSAPPPLKTPAPLPPGLSDAVLRALRKRPQERHADLDAFAAALG